MLRNVLFASAFALISLSPAFASDSSDPIVCKPLLGLGGQLEGARDSLLIDPFFSDLGGVGLPEGERLGARKQALLHLREMLPFYFGQIEAAEGVARISSKDVSDSLIPILEDALLRLKKIRIGNSDPFRSKVAIINSKSLAELDQLLAHDFQELKEITQKLEKFESDFCR